MDDEDESLLRKERVKRMKKLFPNAPNKTVCRICKKKFPNPILQGSSIAVSMCDECRKPYLKKNHIRSRKKKDKIPKSEEIIATKTMVEIKDLGDIKTLKDYLEMKL